MLYKRVLKLFCELAIKVKIFCTLDVYEAPGFYIYMQQIKKLYDISKKSNSNFLLVFLKSLYYKYKGKNIIAHEKTYIKGIEKINIHAGNLRIGVSYCGFSHKSDRTIFNIRGRLEIGGSVSIGRGCRFDVGRNGSVFIGSGSYINVNSLVVIMNKLTIGDNCAISWNCMFLDSDFHQIMYGGKKQSTSLNITIGNHVWIGSNVKIYKGTTIAEGCIVASDSVVKGTFFEPNCLIAGSPAKVIKSNVFWE